MICRAWLRRAPPRGSRSVRYQTDSGTGGSPGTTSMPPTGAPPVTGDRLSPVGLADCWLVSDMGGWLPCRADPVHINQLPAEWLDHRTGQAASGQQQPNSATCADGGITQQRRRLHRTATQGWLNSARGSAVG